MNATPATIRRSIEQTHYAVVCDACGGGMFRDGVLCTKCEGEGRLLIPEVMPRPLLRTVFDFFKQFRSM
jgi:hypothetical protein